MKYFFFLLIGLLTLVASCSWNKSTNSKPDIVKDTLLYQYKTYKQRAADCGDKPDSGCTVVQFKYPVFTAQPAFNDTVRHRTATLFGVYKKADTSFKQFADKFMKAYQQEMVNRNTKIIYTLQTATTVVRQDSALTTLQLSGYSFQGGAHGSSLTTFINWDTKAHKYIKLNDILVDNYQPALDSVAEKIFRKQENLSDTEPLKTNYFFAKDKFSLNDNFSITPMGLRFIYNEYEIKPYAAGKTELFIPYTQIQTLLRPNTVVSQYIK
ncbi:MAG: DUF3298 domain-containing protein [Bacteroidota bacterium]